MKRQYQKCAMQYTFLLYKLYANILSVFLDKIEMIYSEEFLGFSMLIRYGVCVTMEQNHATSISGHHDI